VGGSGGGGRSYYQKTCCCFTFLIEITSKSGTLNGVPKEGGGAHSIISKYVLLCC